MYHASKWAEDLLSLQKSDGSFGYFHALSEPSGQPVTTEQALRRLLILGFTIEDEPIQRAVDYMNDCLADKKMLPDRREKTHDWDLFTRMILSTWVRKFTDESKIANETAGLWAEVVSTAFSHGSYDHSQYVGAYQRAFGMPPRGGRFVDFVSFYQVSLIPDKLDEKTASAVLDYILNHPKGIYYVYNAPLRSLPDCFYSKQASRYLGAVELLASFPRSRDKPGFVTGWLEHNRTSKGGWDLGQGAKDGVYFPLSDSWRKRTDRERDCTARIQRLLDSIS